MKIIFEGTIYNIQKGSRLTLVIESDSKNAAMKVLIPLGSKAQLVREGDAVQLTDEGMVRLRKLRRKETV